MNALSWFVVDMMLVGLNIGIAVRNRGSWSSLLNWVVGCLMLSLAAVQFARWLGVEG